MISSEEVSSVKCGWESQSDWYVTEFLLGDDMFDLLIEFEDEGLPYSLSGLVYTNGSYYYNYIFKGRMLGTIGGYLSTVINLLSDRYLDRGIEIVVPTSMSASFKLV